MVRVRSDLSSVLTSAGGSEANPADACSVGAPRWPKQRSARRRSLSKRDTELSESEDGTAYGIVMLQPVQAGMTGHVNKTGLAKLAENRDVAVSRLHVNTLITSFKEDYT